MLSPRFVAALALILPMACANVLRAPEDGGPTWSRADSAHLYVETDLGPSGARELARDLETWRLAMTAALFERARSPGDRLGVIALRLGELASLNPILQGAFGRLSANDPPTLVLGPDKPGQRVEIMRHELAHAVIAENLSDVPRWLDEGLASLLATANLDEGTGVVTWGHLEIHDANITHYDLAPLDDLVDDVWPNYDIGRYEFSAAFLVRMLAVEHPSELKCLLERLAAKEGYEPALEACFPDRRAWSAQYSREQFRKQETIGTVRVAARPTDTTVTVRPMTDAEVHGALARLNDVVARTMGLTDDRRASLRDAADHHRAREKALGATASVP
jgi:hypothetical protein